MRWRGEVAQPMKAVTALLVDSVRARRQALRTELRKEGFVVYEAGSLRAALQTLRWVVPEVALVDARLPDSSGVAAARALAEHAPEMQAIVMARPASADSIAAALDAVVFATVARDDPVGLLELLRQGLRQRREAAVWAGGLATAHVAAGSERTGG